MSTPQVTPSLIATFLIETGRMDMYDRNLIWKDLDDEERVRFLTWLETHKLESVDAASSEKGN